MGKKKSKVDWETIRESDAYKAYCSERAKQQAIIDAAQRMWSDEVEKYAATHTDREYGSCVLGAGIDVQGFRINAPSRFQGSLTWGHSVDKIIEFLEKNGLRGARYDPGRMD